MEQKFLNLFYVLISLIGAVLSANFKVTHWTKCPHSSRNFMKFVGVSVGQCVDECTRRMSCRSVGYRRRFNLCEVHLEDTTLEDNAIDGSCIFIKKDDMLKREAAAKSGNKAGHVCDESTGHCHKECDTFTLEKGKVYGNRRHAGAKVAFACDDGYQEKNGETSAICEQSGEWSYYPQCELADVKEQSTTFSAAMTTLGTTTTSVGTATISPVTATTSPDKTATSSGTIATSGTSTVSPEAPTTFSGIAEFSPGTATVSSVKTTSSLGTTTTTTATSPATALPGTTTYSLEATTIYTGDTVTYHGPISPSTTTTTSLDITATLSLGTTSTSFETTSSPETTKSSLKMMLLSQEQLQTTQTLTTVFTETIPTSTETASYTTEVTQEEESISVNNGGEWGSWGNAVFCPEGSYASGYDMKIQRYDGGWIPIDDTSLNGIKLYCDAEEGQEVHNEITSKVGSRGDWVGPVFCNQSSGLQFFLIAFNLQVQPRQGASLWEDDTAANFVKFRCRGGEFASYDLANEPRRGKPGLYGPWSEECEPGTAICGLKTKIEEESWIDDTALNDVIFYCCN